MTERRTSTGAGLLGVALGSGAARGWAHIGVLEELEAMGIRPDVVCGTSIGALVGGAYAAGRLGDLREWILGFDRKEVLRHLDVRLLVGGGFVEGRRLIQALERVMGNPRIQDLPRRFAAVACDLATGAEVWFKKGPILEAIRASIALPGLFVPVEAQGRWLVDGGLVNPVPVSLCRALGAETVIAVNLNGGIVGRRVAPPRPATDPGTEQSLLDRLAAEIRNKAQAVLPRLAEARPEAPGLLEVLADSLNIMQDRLTRSRMGGDPPELILAPRTAQIRLMEFERAAEGIAEGRACVRRMAPALEDLMADRHRRVFWFSGSPREQGP